MNNITNNTSKTYQFTDKSVSFWVLHHIDENGKKWYTIKNLKPVWFWKIIYWFKRRMRNKKYKPYQLIGVEDGK